MKRCPYCAEEIQDVAIVCRYCGRDLVPNVEELVNKQSKVQITLTKDEVEELTKIFMDNIKSPSLDWIKNVQGILSEMESETIAPVFDLFLEKKIVSEASFQRELQGVATYTLMWALVCFGVGFEHGLNKLEMGKAIKCTMILGEHLALHYTGYLYGLRTKGGITEEESIAFSKVIAGKVVKAALKIHQFGMDKCGTISRKTPNFLNALGKLEAYFS